MEKQLTPIIKDSFLQFGGAVLQSRALPDVRDLLKPSARQIFYCLQTDKFTYDKPFKKTLKAIGSCFRIYLHGDSSAEGIIMRAGQPFAMRYPLVEVEGSYGTLLASSSWAAPRYTSARLSKLASYLFGDLEKDTIDEWRDNYDDTEQYPMVLPSKGFYNLVNGGMGIGVGASSSIPQYNLRELNEALVKLLWNSEVSFDEIYCVPDFATGALLLNADEVKESHRCGTGAACKLRSVVSYDSQERCLIVTEIPYMVYTETICKQLEEIVNDDDNPGIDRFIDLTGATPLIKIYLRKNGNPDKILKYLLKQTSLQTHYGINFTMLENGRFPKVFTWKEALQAHLDHEKEVYTKGFQFDLKKIKARLHIIAGLIKAYDMINEVVQTIKQSASSTAANAALQSLLGIDETQAKAILDLKLARLSKLDINKLKNEQTELEKEKARIELILEDETLLKKEIEKGLREVAEKFGDERRTQVLNIENESEEPTEVRDLLVSLTNQGNLFVSENSSLFTQRRGGVGNKFKLSNGEYIIATTTAETTDTVLFFTNNGKYYHYTAGDLPLEEKTSVEILFDIKSWEKVTAMSSFNKNTSKEYIIFFTKNGILKKSKLGEYKTLRGNGAIALKLDEGDEVVSVLFTNEEKIGMLTLEGQLVICETKDIRAIGRTARGVVGIKLNSNDELVAANVMPSNTNWIMSVSGDGCIKRSNIKEYNITGRATKGAKIQKLSDGDFMIGFQPIKDEKEVIITSTRSRIKIDVDSTPILSKNTLGNKAIKLTAKDNVIGISKF